MGLAKASGEFFKELLDTHGRIAALGTVILGLGGGTLVAAFAQAFFNVHGLFLWSLGLLIFGLVIMLGAVYVRNNPAKVQGLPAASAAQELAIQPAINEWPNFKFDDYFRLAHTSQLTDATERDIKALVARQHPNDREATLTKFIGIGYWEFQHENTWAYIFRSQILALTELNSKGGMMPLAAAKAHYETAKAGSAFYATYSFDQWLTFMQAFTLLIRHPSDMLEITLRGRDFLKFLTHKGWSSEGRKN